MTNEEFQKIKEKEIMALREYIDALHGTIDSLTNIISEMPEEDDANETYQEEEEESKTTYGRKKK